MTNMALEVADRMITEALRTGATSDTSLLERTALALPTLAEDPAKQLALMLNAVRFLYVIGRPSQGLTVAERAYSFATATADTGQAATALMLIGVCAADTGNFPRAMEAFAESLDFSQRIGDTVLELKTWLNLGNALSYCGLLRDALACYRKVIEMTTANTDVKLAPVAWVTHVNLQRYTTELSRESIKC
jgi:tetratricopeptide (TPR) repeat protein